MRYRYWLTLGASILLALIFLTAGVGKLLGHSAFLLTIESSVLGNQELAAFVASWLPWVELVLGACLLVGIVPQIVAGLSTVLIACFIGYNSLIISQGFGYKPCGCLGVLDRLFQGRLSTTNSLYIDIGLIILALAVYFAYPGKLLNVYPWFLKRGRVEDSTAPGN
jgi:uncharacterized membrane protein YphA (DoxX/SURF4 family)